MSSLDGPWPPEAIEELHRLGGAAFGEPMTQPIRHGRYYASDDDVLDSIDWWHTHKAITEELHEFLGWTWEEFCHWVSTNRRPMPPAVSPEVFVAGRPQ